MWEYACMRARDHGIPKRALELLKLELKEIVGT